MPKRPPSSGGAWLKRSNHLRGGRGRRSVISLAPLPFAPPVARCSLLRLRRGKPRPHGRTRGFDEVPPCCRLLARRAKCDTIIFGGARPRPAPRPAGGLLDGVARSPGPPASLWLGLSRARPWRWTLNAELLVRVVAARHLKGVLGQLVLHLGESICDFALVLLGLEAEVEAAGADLEGRERQ